MWRKEVEEGKNFMENKQQKKSSNMPISKGRNATARGISRNPEINVKNLSH